MVKESQICPSKFQLNVVIYARSVRRSILCSAVVDKARGAIDALPTIMSHSTPIRITSDLHVRVRHIVACQIDMVHT